MRIFFLIMILCATLQSEQKPKLIDHKRNVYSQNGEDGIIEKVFEIIGTRSKVAVEFGAADGFWFSNTANLWSKDPTWSGVLIESNPAKFQNLLKNVKGFSCVSLQKRVGISKDDSIETILEGIAIREVDLLSIDIDGNDYYIFQSLTHLRPRVIICEYNASIPAHVDLYPKYDNYLGCSVAALQRVGAEKGYSLIAITDTNCFFVLNEDFPKFASYDTDREHIRFDGYVTYVISDYEGKQAVLGTKATQSPWGKQSRQMADIKHSSLDQIKGVISYTR